MRSICRLVNERQAISLIFLASGFLVVTWAANIPTVIDTFKISMQETSILIVGVGGGALLSTLGARALIRHFGLIPLILVGGVLSAGILMICLHVSRYEILLLFLVIFGAANGFVDAAMNAAGGAYELQYGRPCLSYFHAFFSLGGMLSAISVWVASSVSVAPNIECIAAASLGLVVLYTGAKGLSGVAVAKPHKPKPLKHRLLRDSPLLFGLGVMAAVCQVCEGAIHDWSAILLSHDLGGGFAQGALGLAVFTGSVAMARFAGNWLRNRLGDVRLLMLSSLLTAAPLFWGAASHSYSLMVAALGLSGFGIANIFPLLVSMSMRSRNQDPIRSAVWLSLCGYTGLLGGPALVGSVAGGWGLLKAFYLLAVLATMLLLGGIYIAFYLPLTAWSGSSQKTEKLIS